MLTEVDTRQEFGTGRSIVLSMDSDTGGYYVTVEGFQPLFCFDRATAVQFFQHPYVYLPAEEPTGPTQEADTTYDPLEATESDSPALGAGNTTKRTETLLIELTCLLRAYDAQDFQWTASSIAEIIENVYRERFGGDTIEKPKPYDHEADGPDIPF